MAGAPNFWRSKSGILILAAICVFALFFALVVTPAISQSIGVADANLSMVLGLVFLILAVGCYSAARVLNKKKAAE